MLRVPNVEVTVCESQVILFDHSHIRNAQQSATYRGAVFIDFLRLPIVNHKHISNRFAEY